MSYARHVSFIAPAQKMAAGWRVAVTLLGTMALTLLFVTILVGPRVAGLPTDGGLYFMIEQFTFACLILGLWMMLHLIHQRGLRTLIGPWRPAVRDFTIVAVAVLGLTAIEFSIWALLGVNPLGARTDLSFGAWLILLTPLLLGLVIQTGAEELLFRGYIQQQIAVRLRHPIFWMFGPSLVFGLLHWFNDEGAAAWLHVVFIAGSALTWADLTARTGNLGAAWGAHFALNLPLTALSTSNPEVDALVLYSFPPGPPGAASLWDFVYGAIWVLLAWRVALWALNRWSGPGMDLPDKTV